MTRVQKPSSYYADKAIAKLESAKERLNDGIPNSADTMLAEVQDSLEIAREYAGDESGDAD